MNISQVTYEALTPKLNFQNNNNNNNNNKKQKKKTKKKKERMVLQFFKKGFIFEQVCFKVIVLKKFEIPSDCHIKICRFLK